MCLRDTVAVSLNWLVLLLAQNPEIQQKCFNEIKASFQKNGEIIEYEPGC